MRPLPPIPPADLDPLARATLERLAQDPVGGEVVIGGGVALKHYQNIRPTMDLDAWWRAAPAAATAERVRATVSAVAAAEACAVTERHWGDTTSLDFARDGQKVFSFQIAVRDVQLEPYVPSAWAPVQIESLADNVASKMAALVSRGMPRDFVDIKALVDAGALSVDECWALWDRKHPGQPADAARAEVLRKITGIALRRPLDAIADPAARAAAQALRTWYADVFVQRGARVRGR